MNEKRKFFSLLTCFAFLLGVLAVTLGVVANINSSTLARYIKREKDEVKAYYTALYFDGTGDGTGIALENNVGYASFDLMNYIDEDVTKRDIVYEIKTVNEFYNSKGELVSDPATADTLNVRDVWKQPVLVGSDTYKYNIEIVSDNGETVKDELGNTVSDQYMFSYEERGTSAVGKKHKVTIKVERKESYLVGSTPKNIEDISGEEKISIVVQLLKPYRTVYVIDMVVSDRLIIFSNLTKEVYNTTFNSILVQSADIFSHTKDGNIRKPIDSSAYKNDPFTSYAFKVTFNWQNLILDENILYYLHNNVGGITSPIDCKSDITLGDADYLDISKPYIVSFHQDTNTGTLTVYVPEGSSFNLDFLATSATYNVKVKVEIYIRDGYKQYGSQFLGYSDLDSNEFMTILEKN